MMNVTVIALGKMKEAYMRDFISEYEKRLSAYCKLNIIELAPSFLPDNPSKSLIDGALREEAKKITAKIPQSSFVYSMCIEGRQRTSEEFSEELETLAVNGKSSVVFIIGSSFGLDEAIKNSSNERISLSRMTFPHQMARIMLLEQLYRAFSISNGGKYHK